MTYMNEAQIVTLEQVQQFSGRYRSAMRSAMWAQPVISTIDIQTIPG